MKQERKFIAPEIFLTARFYVLSILMYFIIRIAEFLYHCELFQIFIFGNFIA